ncbi:MAG: hypothetical protein PUB86_00090 [Elusimicrobia bacterium]|nr:hypothetical protein [Elusimicrobiota bacterium]
MPLAQEHDTGGLDAHVEPVQHSPDAQLSEPVHLASQADQLPLAQQVLCDVSQEPLGLY